MPNTTSNLMPENTRVDPESGATEIAEFFGDGPDRIFGTCHVPPDQPIGGLVICSSIHAELLNSYRTEVLLARAVAARGIAVQRFHYWGHGHSDGASEEATFERMERDALTAARRLAELAPVTVFLGTRWGALVAAAAARSYPAAALALWEPVASAEQFFREALRSRLIRDVKDGTRAARPAAATPAEEMASRGFVEVMGYRIDSALQASSAGRTLAGLVGAEPRAVFIGQIGRAREPRATYRRLIDEWRAAGFEVHFELLNQEEISWFLPNARRKQETRGPLVEATARWIVRVAERAPRSNGPGQGGRT